MKILVAALLAILFAILAAMALYNIDTTNPFTTVTAVVALGISLVSFYFTHIWGIHRLNCTLVAASYDGQQLIAYFTFENTGTFQEIVIGATFVFPNTDGKGYSTLTRKSHHDFLPELCEPFVLKPKEIALKKFCWDADHSALLTHFHLSLGDQFEHLVDVKVDFVNPKQRRQSSKLVNFATLKFYKDFADLSKTCHEQNALFKGDAQII
jgi:hypothetical protein